MKKKTTSTEGQRLLTESYEAIRDELVETPDYVWEAFVRCGRHTCQEETNIINPKNN